MSRRTKKRIGFVISTIGLYMVVFAMCCADTTDPKAVWFLVKLFVAGVALMVAGEGFPRIRWRHVKRSSRH